MSPKKLKKTTPVRLAVPAALLGLLAACGGTPTRYYTLAESTPPATAQSNSPDTAALAIEMGPVALPERLARPQLVVRRSGGALPAREASAAEVEVLEQSRWSSSFEYELRDALASGIAGRLSAFDATKSGRPLGIPVYRIAVQLREFDAQPGTRVDTSFAWSVRRAGADTLVTCQLRLSEAVGGGVDGVALGAQRITARLADEIARNVGALAANQAASCPAA
ncbi:MAG: membrane integrity-associated transporter subunit PqiC [Proteobacteria bacterium]|nr:membrane integrity-associated transporter subunit PqiC [Pseudomonadota bacterium]